MSSNGKEVALIIGASRGIGRQVAIDLAKNGYFVVVSAKTTSDASTIPASEFPPNPNSQASTINTVAREITEAGNSCVALPVNTRDHASIQKLVDDVVSKLGRIDVLIYNSAVETTPLKRFKLMQEVNAEGLYSTLQSTLPIFASQSQPNRARIIVVSPPIYSRFIHGKTAYAMSKLAMTILTLGLAKDIQRRHHPNMSITSIWPAVAITSAATELNAQVQAAGMDSSTDKRRGLRRPEIFSDAILALLRAPAESVNGRVVLDEDYLRSDWGYVDADFERYSVVRGSVPRRIMPRVFPSLEVEEQDEEGVRMDSVVMRGGKL
ncbi:hypothetical protein LTR24_006355 [Lithohypha guttulata]|uniref:Uncharacterized protein n=1 Tax=Lithohypha guttulata TaxID=1690604 RepID=A0ABR0K6A3_9EURO|nr:hypothetical protein LTR24_006355 [Lithohypha guttulata]